MPDYAKNIVYLSQAQYAELIANQSITVDNVTVTYNENDIYVTPQAEPVTDVQVNGASVVSGSVANLPVASTSGLGVSGVDGSFGILVNNNGKLYTNTPNLNEIKTGTQGYKPIVSANAYTASFYGLAKAAGDTTQSQSDNVVGTYTDNAKSAIRTMLGAGKVDDVQVNGVSVLNNGVANVPVGSSSTFGVFKRGTGLYDSNGVIGVNSSSDADVKGGVLGTYTAVSRQHLAAFYGLAKAAGDTTQSQSDNAVGQYTDSAKASIKSMLGIVDGSTGTVEVTGTTPTITAVENTRYVCGEVATLSFTPPASGISIVRFTSGTTATVITLPNTVIFPEWFDATTLEANTVYEICITDGIYGAVMSWAQ